MSALLQSLSLPRGSTAQHQQSQSLRSYEGLYGNPYGSHRHQRESILGHDGLRTGMNGNGVSRSPQMPQQLPAVIELTDSEDHFFRVVIQECQPGSLQFKLAPAFALYMVSRHLISRQFQPQIPHDRRIQMFRFFVGKIVENIDKTISSHINSVEYLAFWLSNSSEFLHILRSDAEINHVLTPAGILDRMHQTVEKCYYYLACLIQKSIEQVMVFVTNADMPDKQSTDEVVNVLEATMNLFRSSRLNAGLTIQLFSHSFYYINQYLFNWMVATPDGRAHLSRAWGVRLRDRLQFIHQWAEKEGLELAAECHMDRIQQAANLLITPKTIDQIASLGATCYKLNSVQVRWLLTHYVSDVCEPDISSHLIENVVRLAEGQADEMAQQDALQIELEEAKTLDMQFMFPPDGYSIENVRDLPPAMDEFFNYCQLQGAQFRVHCQQPTNGSWTVFFDQERFRSPSVVSSTNSSLPSMPPMGAPHQVANVANGAANVANGMPMASQRVPEIVKISFSKGKSGGIGLSIVAAQMIYEKRAAARRPPSYSEYMARRLVTPPTVVIPQKASSPGSASSCSSQDTGYFEEGVGDRELGIYVKNVLDGGAAQRDGRIEIGDQLLSVNGQSLLDITQEQAAQKMGAAGVEVSFEVSKGAANCNGLAAWLSDCPPTPALSTAHSRRVEQPSTSIASGYDSRVRKGSVNSLGSAALPPPPPQGPRYAPQQAPLYSNLTDIPKHNRSISASELYHQSDTASVNSFNSQARTFQTGNQGHYHQLPAHYKQSSRPAVVQPDRPNRTGMSPTPLSNGGGIYGNVRRPSEESYFSNSFSSVGNTAPKSSYASLPTVPPKPNVQLNYEVPSVPVYAAPSGRRSAPLFERQVNEIESSVASAMTREELDEELDRLESKGPNMTEEDKRRYRALVDHIGKHRPSIPVSRSAIDFVNNGKDRKATGLERQAKSLTKMEENPQVVQEPHIISRPVQAQELPFLNEMESRLVAKRSSAESSIASRISPPMSSADAFIDDLNQQFESAASVSSPTLPRSSLSSLRDSPPSSQDERAKKRVNFADQEDHDSRTSSRQENTSPPGTSDLDGPKFIYRKNTEEEENEPRAITTGTQEVYRDPRQRRLDNQALAKKPQVDGANLDFREKMRLFAKQLGEDTPKNRMKASSAQREIEDHLEPNQK
ncbi:hypothetical protein L596_010007 [Steinernema carpocapsae]|uniref:PDZ domain-containing protein n=1 Tax=Steinernema carpocapsae TaxID=34508 RepID=A0A4U5PH17_STECR|nr:hypothetical protein L596_010007 [Steinernema carpocapsae]